MKTFWTPYISDRTIHAICWTLIHSLWIGLIIALLAGFIITITKRSSAALRYNLLCGVLILFALSVWITFWIEMGSSAIGQGRFHVGQIISAPGNHLIVIPDPTAPHVSLLTRVVWLLNEYSNVIFLAWLLLFILKSLKMAGGLLYIQRIRNYKVHEVSEEFKHKVGVFAGQIGISQAVCLVQSELVKVPVAVGWLKPMILLPMGIILQLSPEQLESILWHELAHIRRRDYLVNILQGLVETVFFFNPGLLWLSSLIRAEREACCDDIVLSRMNRKANYLEALLAFGSEGSGRMPLAMSIGSGNQLRDRLKRMVHQENKRLSIIEKAVLVVGLIALSAFTGLPKTTQNVVKQIVDVMIKKPAHALTHKTVTAAAIDSERRQPVSPRKVRSAQLDTPRAKADTQVRFTSVLFKLSDADLDNNDITAQDASGKKYHFVVTDGKLTSMDIDEKKVKETDLQKYQYMITQIDMAIEEKRRFRQNDWQYSKPMLPMAKFKMDGGNPKMFYRDSFKGKFYNGDAKIKLQSDMKLFKSPIGMKPGAVFKAWKEDSLQYSLSRKRVDDLIADLVKDKIVKDAAAVKWFGLSSTEFIVNGQKQPDNV
ncbi:MAG: M56 family metallopeptidase, partial [Bacteroidetes bacterium]|nr:M56 family metallopeptidase [Bacteroidota bacterium]